MAKKPQAAAELTLDDKIRAAVGPHNYYGISESAAMARLRAAVNDAELGMAVGSCAPNELPDGAIRVGNVQTGKDAEMLALYIIAPAE